MFTVTPEELQRVLCAFGISGTIAHSEELLRYHYEEDAPDSKEVRLILKVEFADRGPLVVKFKNEQDTSVSLINRQILFSEHLSKCGVATAKFYGGNQGYVAEMIIDGYDVWVTVEDFCKGQIAVVTREIAEKTGKLLARTHNIAEKDDCHIGGPVLFDFFASNDLFSFESFEKMKDAFKGDDAAHYERICLGYHRHMEAVSPLRQAKTYAVQGDISDCNLFLTDNGEIGMFDFNWCGDNRLFCDAVMQGLFEARLMDYEKELTEADELEMLKCFLRGYNAVRPFSAQEISMLPHLLSVMRAFWLFDLEYGEKSLSQMIRAKDSQRIRVALERMERNLDADCAMVL